MLKEYKKSEHAKKVMKDKDSQGGRRQTRHRFRSGSGVWVLFQVQSEGTDGFYIGNLAMIQFYI